jgi:mannosylglycerate hydrolase
VHGVNHPHDSICGTSADAVHREMMTRFERAAEEADEIVARALEDVVGHDSAAARIAGRPAWHPALLIFNPTPTRRDAVVEADVALFRRDVTVGQQRAAAGRAARAGPMRLLDASGHVVETQVLSTRSGHDLVESPMHYPVSSAVEWRRVALAVRDLPPLGVVALRAIEGGRARSAPRPRASADAVEVEATAMRNGQLVVRVEEAGTLALTDLRSGETFRGLGELWDSGDVGDSYTYSAPHPDRVVRRPDAVAVRVLHAGPLRGVLEITRRYDAIDLDAVTRATLDAGAGHFGIEVEGENRRTDHRLRIAFPLGERPDREVADGHFGPVARVPGSRPRSQRGFERPAPTAPMQRCVSVAGPSRALTLLSDGLPEYELRAGGTLLVTLLRAFGQLSRDDMPERPGHAGWPTPTPEAQCLGPFRARLAVFPHDPHELDERGGIERAAEAFHAPPLASMRRALLEMPAAVEGPELVGEGLVFSAMKPAEDGRGVVLRCYNPLERPVAGAWRLAWPVGSARLARLDETPLSSLPLAPDGSVAFDAPPRAIVTVLLR